jgi:transposase-like protein
VDLQQSRAFLTGLKKRGLTGVHLVISDQHAGLVAAITRTQQGSSHQPDLAHGEVAGTALRFPPNRRGIDNEDHDV